MKKAVAEYEKWEEQRLDLSWTWLPPISAVGAFLAESPENGSWESGDGCGGNMCTLDAENVPGGKVERVCELRTPARFMALLSSVVQELEMEPEDAHMAWELARLCVRASVESKGHRLDGDDARRGDGESEGGALDWGRFALTEGEGHSGLILLMLAILWSNGNGNTCLLLKESVPEWSPTSSNGAGSESSTPDHYPWSFGAFLQLFCSLASQNPDWTKGILGLSKLTDLQKLVDSVAHWMMECPLVQESTPGSVPLFVISELVGRQPGYTIALARVHMVEARLGRMLRARIESGNRDEGGSGSGSGRNMDGINLAGGGPRTLNSEQLAGVLKAVNSPFTVISGGPGTGKTATVGAILSMLAQTGTTMDAIALVAPTGKAANRMVESLKEYAPYILPAHTWNGLEGKPQGVTVPLTNPRSTSSPDWFGNLPEAFTIHRLLGYMPSVGRFAHGPDNPLPYGVVIVDEASMVDQALMDCLLTALHPSARLVLLGDADQLPSVNEGAVLRDLASAAAAGDVAAGDQSGAGEPPSPFFIKLKTSYRMDQSDPDSSAIYRFAQFLNHGEVSHPGFSHSLGIPVRQRPEELLFRGVELLVGSWDGGSGAAGVGLHAGDFLARWWEMVFGGHDGGPYGEGPLLLEHDGYFAAQCEHEIEKMYNRVAGSRILCLTRHWATGTESINRELNRMTGNSIVSEDGGYHSSMDGHRRFLPGEPVMMLHNDYNLGVFNGDQGVVVDVGDKSGRFQTCVAFPRQDRFVGIPVSFLVGRIEHSYAITVHKSQGSEYNTAAVILPHLKNARMLNRALLYTAVTRCKRSVVLVGQPMMVVHACKNQAARLTGLKTYICERG